MSMTRKRPWNLVDTAVYSLCTLREEEWNMNICTYVTPVTLHPKRYMVAVALGTYTHDLMSSSEEAVLQLLAADQAPIVRVLGRKSGRTYDKQSYLRRKDALASWEAMPVLREAVAWIYLRKCDCLEAGDHTLFLMEVLRHKHIRDSPPLTNALLVAQKIIRA
jgi:flavin reductase (DIM6/NTAB) family NADH-FMN oxidoreductase RutF